MYLCFPYLRIPALQIHTCVFRTCVFHPCISVLAFSVLVFSISTYCPTLYLHFPYLSFPVLAISAPPVRVARAVSSKILHGHSDQVACKSIRFPGRYLWKCIPSLQYQRLQWSKETMLAVNAVPELTSPLCWHITSFYQSVSMKGWLEVILRVILLIYTRLQ